MTVIVNPNFAKRFNAQYGKLFRLRSEYTGISNPVDIQCKRCEHTFTKMAGNIRDTLKCECDYSKTGPKPLERTDADWQAWIDERHGKGEYKLTKKQASAGKRVVLHSCGKTFEVTPYNLCRPKRGSVCPCAQKKQFRSTLEHHRKEILRDRGPDYLCLEFDPDKACTYKHKVCGHIWKTTYRSFNLSKNCPECHGPRAEKINALTPKEMQDRIDKAHGKGEYKLLGIFGDAANLQRAGGRVDVRHSCGFEYVALHRGLSNGDARCPQCFPARTGIVYTEVVEGKEYKCQGYEPLVIKELVGKYGDDLVLALDKGMKLIKFPYNGKVKSYRPDFMVRNQEKIIEVKCTVTMGILSVGSRYGIENLLETQAKAKACMRQGYAFKLMLFSSGRNPRKLSIPKYWYDMRRIDLQNSLTDLNGDWA